MHLGTILYCCFGLILVGLLVGFFFIYYAKHRKDEIEQPKYSIFDEDELPPRKP